MTSRTSAGYMGSVYRLPFSEPLVLGTEIWRVDNKPWIPRNAADDTYIFGVLRDSVGNKKIMRYAQADGAYTEATTPGTQYFSECCIDDEFIYATAPMGGIHKHIGKWDKNLSIVTWLSWPDAAPNSIAADGTYLYIEKSNNPGYLFLGDKSTLNQIGYVPGDTTKGGVWISNLPRLTQDSYFGYIDHLFQWDGYIYGFWVAWDDGSAEHWHLFKIKCSDIVDNIDGSTTAQVIGSDYGAGNWIPSANTDSLSFPAIAVTPPSFEESREELEGRGYLSIYIDRLTEAMKVFETINEAIFSYLYNGYDGKYRYRVFAPEPGGSLPTFTDEDIFSFKERVDSSEVISNLRVEYAYRTEQDYPQVILLENSSSQYLQRSPIKVSKEIRLPFTQRNDAQYWSERAILMFGERLVLYDVSLSPRAWTLEPGDFVTIIYARQGINLVAEVLEVGRDLSSGVVDVVLSDQHGYLSGESGGGGTTKEWGYWWWEDADPDGFLPAQFSGLSGYGTGAVSPWNPSWDPAIKSWCRQNVGYWIDDATGLADITDPDSQNASRWY